MEKELAQSDFPVRRKIQKPPEMSLFYKTQFSGGFGDSFKIYICPFPSINNVMVGLKCEKDFWRTAKERSMGSET